MYVCPAQKPGKHFAFLPGSQKLCLTLPWLALPAPSHLLKAQSQAFGAKPGSMSKAGVYAIPSLILDIPRQGVGRYLTAQRKHANLLWTTVL